MDNEWDLSQSTNHRLTKDEAYQILREIIDRLHAKKVKPAEDLITHFFPKIYGTVCECNFHVLHLPSSKGGLFSVKDTFTFVASYRRPWLYVKLLNRQLFIQCLTGGVHPLSFTIQAAIKHCTTNEEHRSIVIKHPDGDVEITFSTDD